MPFGIAAVLGGGSLLGAGIGAFGANQAANTQANAALKAAQLQNQTGNRALDIQQGLLQQFAGNLQPYLQAGSNALAGLQSPSVQNLITANPVTLAGINPAISNLPNMPQYNMAPFTLGQFQASPGYNYELQQQQQAIQNSGAGKTGALSGNTLSALQGNAQGLASQDWWNAVNNYQNNYLNQYNAQNQNFWATQGQLGNWYQQQLAGIGTQQSNLYNVLASLANSGQNAAVNLGSAGTQAGSSMGNILANLGQSGGNFLTQAGNASAAGTVGIANNAVGGINNLLTQLASPMGGSNQNSLLAYLFNQGGYPNYTPGSSPSADFALGYS